MNTINAMREAGTSWENIAHTLQAERDKLQHLLDGAQADYEDAMHALAKAEGKVAELEDALDGLMHSDTEKAVRIRELEAGSEPVLEVTGRSDFPGYVICAEINWHGATIGQKYYTTPQPALGDIVKETLDCDIDWQQIAAGECPVDDAPELLREIAKRIVDTKAESQPAKVPEGFISVPVELIHEYMELLRGAKYKAIHSMARINACNAMLEAREGE